LATEPEPSLGRARAVITYAVYRASAAVLRVLPGPLSRCVAAAVGLLAWAAGPSRRRIVAENLAPVLGVRPDDRRLAPIVRRAYADYGVYWSDAAHLTTAEVHRHPERFELIGIEIWNDFVAEDSGGILVLPHLGCWEAGAAWTSARGYPLTTVAEVLEPPELYAWFARMRRRVDLTVLPVGPETVPHLLATLAQGTVIALLADRDITGDGVPVEFFGQKTRIPGGPALLALRSGATILPCAIYVRAGGSYGLELCPPVDTRRRGRLREDVERVSQEIVNAFEGLIRKAPEQWHVFQPLWDADRADR
jgi:phosphatidylinositol dimannoside acyltransferase